MNPTALSNPIGPAISQARVKKRLRNAISGWPRILALPALVAVNLMLSGCVGLAIGGAAVGTNVATDPRSTGAQIDDQTIEIKAGAALGADEELDSQSHISTVAYDGVVLLVGQTPSPELKKRAEQTVARINKVRFVYNELEIGKPTSIGQRSRDALISTELKTRLLTNDNINGHHIKVTVENGVVYLMGLLSREQGDMAAEVASKVDGVKKVVKLFEYPNQASAASAS